MNKWKTSNTGASQASGTTTTENKGQSSESTGTRKRVIIGGVYKSKYENGTPYIRINKDYNLKKGSIIDLQNVDEKIANLEKLLANENTTPEKAEKYAFVLDIAKREQEQGKLQDVRVAEPLETK